MATRTLTDLETRLLDFAEAHPVMSDTPVAAAIRSEFGWRPISYYQRLLALLDEPAAAVARPMLVNRLRRLRDSKVRARSARSLSA